MTIDEEPLFDMNDNLLGHSCIVTITEQEIVMRSPDIERRLPKMEEVKWFQRTYSFFPPHDMTLSYFKPVAPPRVSMVAAWVEKYPAVTEKDIRKSLYGG